MAVCRNPLFILAILIAPAFSAHADDEKSKIVARLNGAPITEADIALAASDIGPHIVNVPDANRRRLLIDYVINSRLMSEAAKKEDLEKTQAFREKLTYYTDRILKDLYLEEKLKEGVSDGEARELYDTQLQGFEPKTEVRARHILLPTEEAANEVAERLKRGEDFTELASSLSQDPGSAEKGGDLGYFTKDRMVGPFAEAAFNLEPGEASQPIKSKFGWHVIKSEDKRKQAVPTFEEMKDRLIAALAQKKTSEMLRDFRRNAEIEILDSDAAGGQDAPPQDTSNP